MSRRRTPAQDMDSRTLGLSGTLRNLLVVVLFWQVSVRGGSEAVLDPPTQVHVNGSELMWTAGSDQKDVTFSVSYKSSSSESSQWDLVPGCRSTPLTSCDLKAVWSWFLSQKRCFQLRVRAQGSEMKSEPVEACSSHGSPCSPEVQLTARPGSLTVLLSRNHSIFQEYADNARYRIYFGKEGGQLEEQEETGSSMLFQNLEAGQRFCARVQFLLYGEAYGPPSCEQCETIPEPEGQKQNLIITMVVLVLLMILMTIGFTYIFIYKHKKIKQLLQPPYTIPQFLQEPLLERPIPTLPSSSPEEQYDVIFSMTPQESRGVSTQEQDPRTSKEV